MRCLHAPVLAVLLAAACAEQAVWVKPGATQQDFARDSYECERDMRQSDYFGTGIYGAIAAQEFAERCMVARGWSKQAEVAAPEIVGCRRPDGTQVSTTLSGCGQLGGTVTSN
jgi:hypothetical protein